MRLFLYLLLLQLWGNVEVSLSQIVCPTLPDVPHARVSEETKKAEYQGGHVIHFTCEAGYATSGPNITYVCSSEGWLAVQQGRCRLCQNLPDVLHAHVSEETQREEYQGGHVIHFTCEPGYNTSGPAIRYVCSSSGWLAVQQGTCISSTCTPPPADARVTIRGLPEKNDPILAGHLITFSCVGYGEFLIGSSELTCGEDGQWDHPFPSCGDPSVCGNPPSLDDGDITTSLKTEYRHGDRVQYRCQAYYEIQGGPYKTCRNGEWTGSIKCLKPCTVDKDIMKSHNIAFRYSHQEKLYVTHNESIEFRCTSGRHYGTYGMRQRCRDGVINFPTCQ